MAGQEPELPRRVRWHERLGGRTSEFEPLRASKTWACHHVGPFGQLLPGPCVGRVFRHEVYLRVHHGPVTTSALSLRCAALADYVVDDRLTPALHMALLQARGGLLSWIPGVHPDAFVWVSSSPTSGESEYDPVVQAATLWLHRHGLVRLPVKPTDTAIMLTGDGVGEIVEWQRESVEAYGKRGLD